MMIFFSIRPPTLTPSQTQSSSLLQSMWNTMYSMKCEWVWLYNEKGFCTLSIQAALKLNISQHASESELGGGFQKKKKEKPLLWPQMVSRQRFIVITYHWKIAWYVVNITRVRKTEPTMHVVCFPTSVEQRDSLEVHSSKFCKIHICRHM